MHTEPQHIQVLMPDDSLIDVSYYCMEPVFNHQAKLIIQLDDCICSLDIEESVCKNINTLESLVHNKVINTKGHLC